jgi:hypothetical protein
MALGYHLLRRCTRFPAVAAPVLIALAAVLALRAVPTHGPAEMVGGWPADGTQFFPEASRRPVGSYSLSPRRTIRDATYAVSFHRHPASDSLVVAATFARSIPGQLDAIETSAQLLSLGGDTLASYRMCSEVAPTGRWVGGCPECVVRRPR